MIYRSSDSIRKTLNNVYQNIIKNISAQAKKRIIQISKKKRFLLQDTPGRAALN